MKRGSNGSKYKHYESVVDLLNSDKLFPLDEEMMQKKEVRIWFK